MFKQALEKIKTNGSTEGNYLFQERYSTPGPTNDMKWFWKDGILTNEFYCHYKGYENRGFLYLHLMSWCNNKWFSYHNHVIKGAKAPWERLGSIINIDWRLAKDEGFMISPMGINPINWPQYGKYHSPNLQHPVINDEPKEQRSKKIEPVVEKEEFFVAKINELENEFEEIKKSKVYKVSLVLRKLREILIPRESPMENLMRLLSRLYEYSKNTMVFNLSIRDEISLIKSSRLFDKEWYLINNPDVAKAKMNPYKHFILYGGFEGRNPSSQFNSLSYIEDNPFIKKKKINPLVHYLKSENSKEEKNKNDNKRIEIVEDANVINMFWHGDHLSSLETTCIKSFIDHGHSVCVFTYNDLQLPDGAIHKDAGQILPKEDLFIFNGSPSAFSNIFRYKLLLEQGGWWVDTDVLCLSEQLPNCDYFWAEEEPGRINGAVLKFPAMDEKCSQLLNLSKERSKSLTEWGQLGPNLLTEVLMGYVPTNHNGETFNAYPIHWSETHFFCLPEFKGIVESRIIDSSFLHLWHSFYKQMDIDITCKPPEGSFLEKIFTHYGQNYSTSSMDMEKIYQGVEKYLDQDWLNEHLNLLNKEINDLLPQQNNYYEKYSQKKELITLQEKLANCQQQLSQKSNQLTEIHKSKAWKLALQLRRIREFIFPRNSYRERIAKVIYRFILSPKNFIHDYYSIRRDYKLIKSSGCFDEQWYISQNPDVEKSRINPIKHYLQYGGFEGRDPGPDFSSNCYLENNEDVRNAGINPLIHYLKYGRTEGRLIDSLNQVKNLAVESSKQENINGVS